jgi:hypothetical protein
LYLEKEGSVGAEITVEESTPIGGRNRSEGQSLDIDNDDDDEDELEGALHIGSCYQFPFFSTWKELQ